MELKKKKYIYPACFYREDNGQYSVVFPDFGGATYGNDLEDAYYMANDYLKSIICTMTKDNEELPASSDIQTLILDQNYVGKSFAALIAVDAVECRDGRAVKKTLTIPKWLDDAAAAKKINFSKVLQEALKERLSL